MSVELDDELVTRSDLTVGLEEGEVSAGSGVDVCVGCSVGSGVVVDDVTAAASGDVNEVAAAARVVEVTSAPVPTPGVGGEPAAVAMSLLKH